MWTVFYGCQNTSDASRQSRPCRIFPRKENARARYTVRNEKKRNKKTKLTNNHSPRIKITTCLHHPGSPSIAINNAPRSGRVNACAHAAGVNPFFIPPGGPSFPCDSLATNLARNSRQSTFSRADGGPSSFAASPSARATIEDCRRGFECTF